MRGHQGRPRAGDGTHPPDQPRAGQLEEQARPKYPTHQESDASQLDLAGKNHMRDDSTSRRLDNGAPQGAAEGLPPENRHTLRPATRTYAALHAPGAHRHRTTAAPYQPLASRRSRRCQPQVLDLSAVLHRRVSRADSERLQRERY